LIMKALETEAGVGSGSASASASAAPIAALPELTAEQRLEAKVTELMAANGALQSTLEQLDKTTAQAVRERDAAVEKVTKIEGNTFMQVMGQLDAGAVLEEAGVELEKAVKAVSVIGGKGEVTIKVTVRPPKETTGTLVLDAGVGSKIPKPKSEPSLFYPLADGKLSRKDPRQREFEGRGFEGRR
jgi:hypothetical protein